MHTTSRTIRRNSIGSPLEVVVVGPIQVKVKVLWVGLCRVSGPLPSYSNHNQLVINNSTIPSIAMCVSQNEETYSSAVESMSKELRPGVAAAIFTPRKNRFRYAVGLKCQSIIHNTTDEVVYAFVTSRIIEATNTANENISVGTSAATATVPVGGGAGLGFAQKVKKGPIPATIVPIAPNHCYTVNLDRRSYYLTFGTVKKTAVAFHRVHEKVPGYNDYFITSKDLQYHVNHELAEKFVEMIELAIKKSGVPMN